MSNDKAKVSSSALNSLLGIMPTKGSGKNEDPERAVNTFRLTNDELIKAMRATYVHPDNSVQSRSATNSQNIRSYLGPISESIGERALEVKKMKALAPEIDQSRILVASSILSPNDLAEGSFNFKLDNVTSIDEKDTDLVDAVQKLLSEHFNDNLKLGVRSFDWIGDALYGSGVAPLMLLPQATLEEAIRKKTNPMESNYFTFSSENYRSSTRTSTVLEYDDYFYSGSGMSFAEWVSEDKVIDITTECYPVLEESNILKYDLEDKACPSQDKCITTMESMVAVLKKKLSSGDIIRVSEDPSIMKWTTVNKKKNADKVIDKFGVRVGEHKHYDRQDIISLNVNPEGGHKGHPMLIELPPEAVVPIHVPGTPHEHLGYFVLIDNYGHPVQFDESKYNTSPISTSNGLSGSSTPSVKSAHVSVFGSEGTSVFGGYSRAQSVGSMLFSTILDKYVKSRLNGVIGEGDLEISRFHSITNVMLQRLMANKRTTLLYVPAVLMHYITFDYNELGCGKSRLEDLRPLLAMRTNLMMARIIAAANNAIEHKTIQFETPTELANLEGAMEVIHQIFQRKRNVTGSFVPDEISSNMYANRVTVLPSKIPGLEGPLKVDVESKSANSISPDDALIEQITNLIGSMMIMHPSALNTINEPEHSRSLATINMFYSKQITQLQTIFCNLMTRLVQTYIQFSIPLQKALLKIIADHYKSPKNSNVPRKKKKLLAKGDTNKQYSRNAHAILQDIIAQIEVKLPSPDIIVGKSQFEEVRTYVSTINEMAEVIFSNEMILSSQAEVAEALTVIKQQWKYNQIKEFTSKVGKNNLYDIPELDSFMDIIDNQDGLVEILMNINARINGSYNVIAKARQNMEAELEGGDDMGDDMGMDDDMDMGGDDDSSDDMGDIPSGGDEEDTPSEGTDDPNKESSDVQMVWQDDDTVGTSLKKYLNNIRR